MASTDRVRADCCHTCGKDSCAGSHNGGCKKCPKRLEGDCANVFFPVYTDKWIWECGECWLTRMGAK